MGLFDDYDIDMDEVEAVTTGSSIPDGHYDFEISEGLVQNGTKNKPDTTFLIIKYDLDENGSHWEWFTLAEDGNSNTKKAKQSLGFLKNRLIDLGFAASALNDLDPEDFEGIRGTLELKTTSGKGANAGNKYQNLRNVKVEADDADEPAEADETPDTDDEIKKRVAARRAAREGGSATVKKAPAKRTSKKAAADDDEDENPFGG